MPLKIRLATERDVPRMLEFSNWAAEHSTANFATQPEPLEEWRDAWRRTNALYPWLVAESDGEVVGFARASPHKARGAYAWAADVSVYIGPASHGRGVGSALYGRLIPILRTQGYVTLIAGIVDGHEPSEKLHARFGFTRCGTFHRVGWKLGRWCDVGYWELSLRAGAEAPPPIRPVQSVWADPNGA